MKQRNIFFLSILLFITLSACKKDFLNVENTEEIFRQVYVKDLKSMQEFVNGVYVIFTQHFEDGRGEAYSEVVADNLKPRSITDVMLTHYAWKQVTNGMDLQHYVANDANGTAMDALWRIGYKVIRACNFVIEDIDKYQDTDPAKAENMKGQVLAIRAYVHFRLVNTFAQNYTFTSDGSHPGIPYITTSDITKPYSRQTVKEVYNNIISDLKNAIELLSETVTDTRLMNRNAARALLARTYLFKEDFLNAKILAKEIADQIPLMTISNGYPNDIFRLKLPSQTESLFQLNPQSTGYRTDFLGRFLRQNPIRFVATNDIVLILSENSGDVRQAWVSKVSSTQWNVIKYPIGVEPSVTPVTISYYPALIRSSEMFLTVAEASAKSGDENTARTYLDSVRRRANILIAPVIATGSALIDSIYKERRKELAFEGLRMFDLQRWKLGVHRIDAVPTYPTDLSYPNDKSIAPIPLNDILLGKLDQNPGYN